MSAHHIIHHAQMEEPCLLCLISSCIGHEYHRKEIAPPVLIDRSWVWSDDSHQAQRPVRLAASVRRDDHGPEGIALAHFLFEILDEPGAWLVTTGVGQPGASWQELMPRELTASGSTS